MDKIDRLGWAAGLAADVFGVRVGIRVQDSSVLDLLLSRLPSHWTPLESAVVDRLYSVVTPTGGRENLRQFCVLYGDHARLTRTNRFQDLLDSFESDLDLHIAANSRDWLFVHAGAVKWRGDTILIPGASHTGKSSLVSEFLNYGASFYADDFAILDRSGCLHAYGRPLCLRIGAGKVQKVHPEYLGVLPAGPARVSLVLFTEYDSEASWRPQKVSSGQGMLRLLQNTPSARKRASFVMDALSNAIHGAAIHVGFRGEKGETVRRILDYVDHRSFS